MMATLNGGGHRSRLAWLVTQAKIVGHYTGLQASAQAMTILAGLIIVRSLEPGEYSYVVLVTAAAGAVQAIGESGIISAISAIGSANLARAKIGSLLASALQARRRLYPLSVLFALPLFPGVASQAALTILAPLWAVILLLSYLQLRSAIYAAIPRLLLHAHVIARYQLTAAASRLIAVAVLFWLRVADAFWYLVASVSAAALQAWMMGRWVSREVGTASAPSPELLAGIQAVTRRQLPNTIFYVFQSQLTVFIAAYFGGSGTVAELGALSRLGLIAGLVILVTNDVVQPRLARRTTARDVRVAQLVLLVTLAAGAAMAVAAALAFPAEILWLLGGSYGHLGFELPLAIGAISMSAIAGAAYAFNLARGWALPPTIAITTGLAANVLLLMVIDVSTLGGVLLVSILSGAASVVISSAYTWRRAASLEA